MSATSAVDGAQYSVSQGHVITFTASAPGTPITTTLTAGSYYLVASQACWVRVGKDNTDVATVPTTIPSTPNRQLFLPAEFPTPLDIPPGQTAYITAIGETSAGSLRVTGPILTAPNL